MIKFIYGNPGTGKTEEIFKMLEDDARNKKSALLIVPEQMTVSAERELLKRLPASAQLHIEVLNYTRLANKLFREHGGVAYNSSTRGLQKLLMWRAIMIAAPLLSEYCRSGDDDIALADSFLSTYNELTAAGISLEAWKRFQR
jgi:ATP-dependent helicase/nuclease subunit B